ncbi:MAG: sugar phosphate isomerase/epimerase [Patescibacteria group bacterium]|nr:sugar phosphate isomerase/epimerase [Patescibacteria group bacterium]
MNKKAISNIAWEMADDTRIQDLLKQFDFHGIEIAPTKIWPDLSEVTAADADRCRESWEDAGFRIVAMQSILYGKPELTLFESEEARIATIAYHRKVFAIAHELGVKKIVFGSPKNRRIPLGMSREEANSLAYEVFTQLADYSGAYGIYLCIEANPERYGGNYITKTAEALALVQRVNHPYLRLHLDTGELYLTNEPIRETIRQSLPFVKHVHVSEPDLDPIGTHALPHQEIAACLREGNYTEWISIEMRPDPSDSKLVRIRSSLAQVAKLY